jgi:hypothetical protein
MKVHTSVARFNDGNQCIKPLIATNYTQPYVHATNFCKPIFCAILFLVFSRFRDVITLRFLQLLEISAHCLLKFIIHICSLHIYRVTEQEMIYYRRNNKMLSQVANIFIKWYSISPILRHFYHLFNVQYNYGGSFCHLFNELCLLAPKITKYTYLCHCITYNCTYNSHPLRYRKNCPCKGKNKQTCGTHYTHVLFGEAGKRFTNKGKFEVLNV